MPDFSNNSKRVYYYRKTNGLCTRCGKVSPTTNKLKCDDCLNNHNNNTSNLYRERRLKGLCKQCGEHAIKGKSRCQNCTSQNNVKRVINRQNKIEKGICTVTNCSNLLVPTKTMCQSCLNKIKERAIKRRKEDAANDLCRDCRLNKPCSKSGRCKDCLKVSNDEGKKRRVERRLRKECIRCGNQTFQNKSLCNPCIQNDAMLRAEKKDAGLCITNACYNDCKNGMSRCCECNAKTAKRRRSIKQKILNHYGQMCNCNCGCAVTKFEWLSVDHKNNDGADHRRKLGSISVYDWIIRNNFPDNIQILCFNCNCAKQFYGGCQL